MTEKLNIRRAAKGAIRAIRDHGIHPANHRNVWVAEVQELRNDFANSLSSSPQFAFRIFARPFRCKRNYQARISSPVPCGIPPEQKEQFRRMFGAQSHEYFKMLFPYATFHSVKTLP